MEDERQRNINVWLPVMYPLLGTWPATQACDLTGNQTSNPLVLEASTQSTDPHQPGLVNFFMWSNIRNLLYSFIYEYPVTQILFIKKIILYPFSDLYPSEDKRLSSIHSLWKITLPYMQKVISRLSILFHWSLCVYTSTTLLFVTLAL